MRSYTISTRCAVAQYKGLIPACIPGKKNNSPEHCYLFAIVAYCRELAAGFLKNVFRCDDMNKIKVGPQVVSKYHQIERYFPTVDTPNYPDHDFPGNTCIIATVNVSPSNESILKCLHSWNSSTTYLTSRESWLQCHVNISMSCEHVNVMWICQCHVNMSIAMSWSISCEHVNLMWTCQCHVNMSMSCKHVNLMWTCQCHVNKAQIQQLLQNEP